MTDNIVELPLEQLQESAFNPRQIFDAVALQDLADSISAEGRVHQPLLVRPIVPPLFKGDPAGQAGHEIVFGHRRFRAAKLAGLATVPCMVRELDDVAAKRAQIAENLQRVDVHPIEEAEGFQALIDQHGETADRIAEQVGKSRSHVYSRLKLLQAVPTIRKACLDGKIGSEVALLIARLRHPKLQEKALGYIDGKYWKIEDGGAKSYRQIRDLLNERFTLELKSAMFDPEDEMLVPAAGHCMRCPKLSGNAPEYSDLVTTRKSGEHRYSGDGWLQHVGPNVCTDPDCFDSKKKAHLVREAKALEAKGKTLVTGNAARAAVSATGEIKGAYVPLAAVKDALKSAKTAVDVITIQDPRTGKTHQAVKADAVKAAGVKVAAPKTNGGSYERDRQKREAEHKAREAKAKALTERNLTLLDKVRAAAVTKPRSTFDLQLVAQVVWAGVEWDDRESLAKLYDSKVEAMTKRIGQMSADVVGMFMLDCALIKHVYVDGWEVDRQKPEELLAAAKHYGVDVDQVKTEPEAPGPKAAPAKSKAAKSKAPKTDQAVVDLAS